ncbi:MULTISPECIES: hypothetical protein [Peribacillus]|nr:MULTISPECIES: hypothetical protein [Peribacillus]MDQ0879368.1 hypothetical protein [Peribacillus sp. V2I11]
MVWLTRMMAIQQKETAILGVKFTGVIWGYKQVKSPGNKKD